MRRPNWASSGLAIASCSRETRALHGRFGPRGTCVSNWRERPDDCYLSEKFQVEQTRRKAYGLIFSFFEKFKAHRARKYVVLCVCVLVPIESLSKGGLRTSYDTHARIV